MSSIDSRIVTMKFDNQQFEQGAGTTMGTIDKLKSSLNFTGASKGLSDVQANADKVHFGTMEGGITKISAAFVALSTVAITALSNITNKAVDAGLNLAKSLTIAPIKAGFDEYELKLGSIQTILANTAKHGTTLGEVTDNLNALNEYSDKTIYNFGEMTKNIGLFTNAGIKIEDATSMIKGFSNSAAASGTSADGAAHAAQQLSQALSVGKVTLMDWKSLTNVGMGNKNMQEGLIDIADAMGTFQGKGIKANDAQKNFNGTLEKGWLTSDVMSSYLKIMAGDMDVTQMKALGLSDSMVKTFQEQQKTAEEAATKVRTFTQLLGTIRESVGSGWSETFELTFGNFEEATDLFTNINNVVGEFVGTTSDARNKVIGDWKELGGRTVLLEAISNVFHAIIDVLKPIKEAFRDIFPAQTGQGLFDLTEKFRDFTEKLTVSGETAEKLKRTFSGVFAIFSIIGQVIKGVLGVIGDLAGAFSSGGGGVLDFTAKIGDFLVGVNEALKKGELLENFFNGLSDVLQVPIRIFQSLIGFIRDLFGGFDSSAADGVADSFGRIGERLSPLQTLIENVVNAFKSLPEFFSNLAETMGPVAQSIFDAIASVFSSGNFEPILDLVNTGLLAGLALLVKKWLTGGGLLGNIFGSSGASGMFGSITGAFDQLTGTLSAMQTNLKADTLLKIAGAVGILTVSVVALSLIDSAALTKSITALGFMFGELLAAMAILDRVSSATGFIKIPFIAGGMILLSTAIVILTAAVKNLSDLSWGELAKGLVGVAALLGILSIAVIPLSANSSGMIRAGAGILAISIGLKVMVSVLKDFNELSWSEIGQGLAGVAGTLLVVAGAMQLMPTNMVATAAGLVLVGVALKVIASAIEDLGGLSWTEIGKGLAGIAGALVVIAGAMRLMPTNMIATAAGLVIVGIALMGISKVIESMSGMSWEEIAKGLITLAGALIIIAVGLKAMTGTIAGSAALLIAAAALAILTPVLKTLGDMSWTELLTGLAALAGVFVVLGVAGLLLAPIIPVIVLLGVSVLAIGAGMALAGVGVLAFVTAITMLIAVGAGVTAAVTALLAAIIAAIPLAMAAFAQGIIDFAKTISEGGPAFVAAMKTVMESILTAIDETSPKIAQTLTNLLDLLLKTVKDNYPKMLQAGFDLLISLLNGIANNIGDVAEAATNVAVEFLEALAKSHSKLVDAGFDYIIELIKGITKAVNENSEEMGRAGGDLAVAIVKGMVNGIGAGIGSIKDAAVNAAKAAVKGAIDFLKIGSPSKVFYDIGMFVDQGFADGIKAYSGLVDTSVENMGESAMDTMKSTMAKVSAASISEIDMNPVVTPVLDLTSIQKEAGKMGAILAIRPLVAGVSFSRATSIAADQQAIPVVPEEPFRMPTEQTLHFEQNNYSPKALSAIEIYRNTRNQFSLAKEALVAS